jgi:hypothetical protein
VHNPSCGVIFGAVLAIPAKQFCILPHHQQLTQTVPGREALCGHHIDSATILDPEIARSIRALRTHPEYVPERATYYHWMFAPQGIKGAAPSFPEQLTAPMLT